MIQDLPNDRGSKASVEKESHWKCFHQWLDGQCGANRGTGDVWPRGMNSEYNNKLELGVNLYADSKILLGQSCDKQYPITQVRPALVAL